ncbi:hypothetical protein HYH03_017266 [Edaphochlamys debaryana]|uniref:HECT-type E3 ubiquitin transferase n=1 Tax=Edaphochlamys debaryana TaxID=47281 RepID=A0A835XI70_9CHLO|nr:hypothetical protein HYH03_017266 [Edaphochlamys debaryana]|eukprot:KAG2483869.1 hypothetical protein HYH03_017266 [Edaphochlamys debaryana]
MRGLGGATRKEQTRDELLAQVRAERAARTGAKHSARAAVAIQRAWRGHAARRRLRAALVEAWGRSYGPLVAAADARLSAEDVAGKLLPPFLFLLKPPSAPTTAPASASTPASTPASTSGPPPLLLPPAGSPLSQLVRGGLALLLRSCAAPAPPDCYLALATEGDRGKQEAWRQQAWRLLLTCCRLVAAPRAAASATATAAGSGSGSAAGGGAAGGDAVVDAAALRVAALLTDAGAWKWLPAGPSPQRSAAEAAAAHLRLRLADHPAALFSALARLLAAQQQQQQQQQQQLASGPSGAPPASQAPGAQAQAQLQAQQLSRLLGLALSVLQAALDAGPGGPSGGGAAQGTGTGGGPGGAALPPLAPGAAQRCVAAFARLVLVAPRAVALVPPDMQARLRAPGVFVPLCRCVRQLVRERAVRGGPEAAWVLSNLLQLLLGPQMRGGPGGGVLAAPPEGLWGPGGEVGGELVATAAALLAELGGGRLAGGPALAAAVEGLWPLGQRSLLVPLMAALESYVGGVEAYAEMCAAAIDLEGRLRTASVESGVRIDPPGVLNALAFSPALLPRLWRWLAFALGLPRDCPAAASRGLDVAALAGGYAGLRPRRARVLGLFCRAYAQLLLVLDDGEFYEAQRPLELAAARAVGASLNSLVYHTYLPKPPPDGSRPPPPPAPTDPCFALLTEWAPRLLRALYERHVRRPYCQPLLWLAPYVEMFGEGEPPPVVRPPPDDDDEVDPAATPPGPDPAAAPIGPFQAGAVLQSLVYGTGGDEEDLPGPAGAGGGAAAAAAGGGAPPALLTRAGEGCRPASIASLLRVSPQSVPFNRRVDLLRALLAEDKARGRWALPPHSGGAPAIKVTVRRASLIEDAYAALAHVGAGLKARLQVTFINEAGMTEAGLDFGGLQKELLERVVSAGLDANYGLFTSTPEGLAFPNPAAERLDGGLALLEFMGLMFGKALYEGILLPVPFAHFFVARLQGRQPLFDDLATLDPELHKNLLMVKRYEGDVSDLSLTFSAETDYFGCPVHHELLPGRGDEPVTNDSRLLYVHLLADWHLNGKLGAPAAAFARGLFALIPQASLRLFNPREFNQLLSGAAADGGGLGALDVTDMRRHCRYSGGYKHDSSTVKLFWRVLAELTPQQQAALLRFVTSCSRPPLGGFRYLQPPLTVHKVDCDAGIFAVLGGRDVDRLPSASTCYNMLKLPNYRRASTLKAKLLYAVTSGAGFELS